MAGKKNVLSSLAVYAEDSEPESDDEAGVETAGSAAGEAREGSWKGRSRCLLGMLLPLRGGRERDGHCAPSIRPRSPEERSGSPVRPSIRRSVVRMDRLFLLIRLLLTQSLRAQHLTGQRDERTKGDEDQKLRNHSTYALRACLRKESDE